MILVPRRRARSLLLASMLGVAAASSLVGCVVPPPTPDMRPMVEANATASGPVPFQVDDNRVFVTVVLIGADGREHPTLERFRLAQTRGF